MGRKKRQETKEDAASICVLALAADNSATNNSRERRKRERLEANNKLIGSIATPKCGSTSVDRGQCPEPVADPNTLQGKIKRPKRSTRRPHVVKVDPPMDIVANNSVLVSNPSACATDNVKSWPNLEVVPKKERSKRKRMNNVESDKARAKSQTANSVTWSPKDKGLISPLLVNSLGGDGNEATPECKRHILGESSDISPKLEARCFRPTSDVSYICSPCNSDGKTVPSVSSRADTSLLENHDGDEGVNNMLPEAKIQKRTHQTREELKTYTRKRKKVCNFPIADSKSIQVDTSSLEPFVQQGNTSLDHSVEMLSGDSTKDLNEKRRVEEQGSPSQFGEDLLEKVVDDHTDVESLAMENERSMSLDISTEKAIEGFLDKDMLLADSLKQNLEHPKRINQYSVMDMQDGSTISHVGRDFDDEFGKVVPDEPVDKHSILLLPDLTNSRDGTTPVDKDVNVSVKKSLIETSRKTLLVLDINGLLADIVADVPNGYTPETIISGKAVFKRPYCDDFLEFCFTRFSVGVWSSRMRRNVELILDFLMGEAKKKLLFCWDQSHCTYTGFNTVENRKKPLVVKKLRKLWEKYDSNLPWDRGDYNETNTLLLDDSPYKALVNPPHTAIFPHSYRYSDKEDNSLGPGGALRLYLEGLANAENVQKYVEENPFGQRPITEKNLSWRFYCKVIEAVSSASRCTPNRYSRVNLQWRGNR